MKFLFSLFFTAIMGWSTIISPAYHDNRDLEVLNNFDIDESFLTDSLFMSMKESVLGGYKKERLIRKYDEAFAFVPILKDMINESGIPPAFLYLAMAESEFSVRAYSPKRASGLWQFIPGTAKLYKLRIDSYVDERRDPIKSTRAAIAYLKHLHKKFGKWYLAAFAYNCGEGRVYRAIKRAGTDELAVLLNARKRYLPRESRNYIRKILSLAMAFNSVELMLHGDNGHLMNRGAVYPIISVTLKGGTHLQDVAEAVNLPIKEIRKYNRHLRYDFIPPLEKDYDIYLPYVQLAAFKENFDPSKLNKNVFMVHRVKKGETLSGIGRKYRIPWAVIRDTNKLKNSRIKIRQKLIIPIRKGAVKTQEYLVRKTTLKAGNIYVIRRGDTIGGISRKFRTSKQKLMQKNNLSSHLIKAGDTLVIPN